MYGVISRKTILQSPPSPLLLTCHFFTAVKQGIGSGDFAMNAVILNYKEVLNYDGIIADFLGSYSIVFLIITITVLIINHFMNNMIEVDDS